MEVDAVGAGEVFGEEAGYSGGEEEVDVGAEGWEPAPVGLEELEGGACEGDQSDGDDQGFPEAFVDEVNENYRGEGRFDAEAEGEKDCRD